MGIYQNSRPTIIKESSRGFDRVTIEEELMQSRELFVTDAVTADTMTALFMQLLYLYRQSPDEEITIYINSPGGEVSSGMGAVELLRLIQAPIRTVCIGTAASMGAILFLMGDKREMLPNTQLMIHDPAPGGGSMAGLKPAEIEERLNQLRKTQEVLGGLIAERTGKKLEEVLEVTCSDAYFDPEEAVEFGLATGIAERI